MSFDINKLPAVCSWTGSLCPVICPTSGVQCDSDQGFQHTLIVNPILEKVQVFLFQQTYSSN